MQIWQWIRHGAQTAGGITITAPLVAIMIAEEAERMLDAADPSERNRVIAASDILRHSCLEPEFPSSSPVTATAATSSRETGDPSDVSAAHRAGRDLARDGSRATFAEQHRVVVDVRHCHISHSREHGGVGIEQRLRVETGRLPQQATRGSQQHNPTGCQR